MLEKGVGVHHAGLSDDVRALMEWLAESSSLRMLCATSTIAQGINFPVSSVFLSSRYVPQGTRSVEIAPREFWNLAGRAGRIGHDSVGVVGLSEGKDRDALIEFVSRSTGALVSRLVVLLDELAAKGSLAQLSDVLWKDQWEDFRCYIAHLWAEKRNLDVVLADSEQLLRQTDGYTSMRNDPEQRQKTDACWTRRSAMHASSPRCPKGSRSLRIRPGSHRKASRLRCAASAVATGRSPGRMRGGIRWMGRDASCRDLALMIGMA